MTRKILIIEDDPNVRGLIIKLLKAEGFEVIDGANGQAGIDLAQTHEPDLIICDIMMPKLDGYQVLEQLRQIPETARIPFIFLTAKADRADFRQGMELGADDYLTKPFKRSELLGAITARLAKQETITQPYLDEMKRAAQTLSQLAYRDPLTNLPNRILLHHQLQEAIRQAQQAKQRLALFSLNLDRFTLINTTLGYSIGDLLLQKVAERLDRAFGPPNTVARIAGDEFSLLLVHVSSQRELVKTAQHMLNLLTEPFELENQLIRIHASIGFTLYPDHSGSADQLLHQADMAMRHAKAKGIDQYEFYTPEMDTHVASQRQLEVNLESALIRGEFQMHYQPQVDMVTRQIIGAEALLRWHNPNLGAVSPSKFIPIAEATGLIFPLGQWAMETACRTAIAWLDAHHPKLQLSVNLSARQFKQATLLSSIDQILEETGLDPTLLVVELTETSVMEDVEATIQTLQMLKTRGIHISIDDFGTGYSSLNYLKRFPIDSLKIDRSFVQDITRDPNDAAISKAVIAMARSLNLTVVAEGVETQAQFDFLLQHGCHVMQGFLFSDAVPPEVFAHMLQEKSS
ncbi:MAG: EAL domain-containing protein [Leptolyngbyaceae cyanobacterium]